MEPCKIPSLSRLDNTSEFEDKAKKFFGENEDFHKKRVQIY